jgi:integrase
VNRSRQAPLQHPLSGLLERAIEDVTAALTPDTARQYRGTARNFLLYLTDNYPGIDSLKQLRRDPHILGWLAHLRSHQPPLAVSTLLTRILFLRGILQRLAWTAQVPELAYLLHREDAPRRPKRLLRPLTGEQDEAVQQELLRRNDLAANVFLLLRHTGMRIGEAVDLSIDCLHSCGPDQWAILVPLGKLKTERMVPVDSFVCQIVQRLRFFRSFDPLPQDGRLIARTFAKETLIRKLRDYLHEVCHAVGISGRIVPHRMRHTYATQMLRSGVTFPAVMKLLGHKSADMTLCMSRSLKRTCSESSIRLNRNRGTSLLVRTRHSRRLVQAWMVSSIRCSSHSTRWKCFAGLWTTVIPVGVSIGFPIASAKSSLKSASSLPDQNGHRLAG